MSWLMKKKDPVNLEQFNDLDEDALVEGLSPEELADLNAAIDPEVRAINRNHVCFPSDLELSIQSCQVVCR